MAGGKSRKTGGVSEKLIQKLKAMSDNSYVVKVNSSSKPKKSCGAKPKNIGKSIFDDAEEV